MHCDSSKPWVSTSRQAYSLIWNGISTTDACTVMLAGSLSEYSVRSSASGTAQVKPGDKLTGRYYQASGPAAVQAAAIAAAATASNAAESKSAHDEVERLGRLAELERTVAANPANEELWLLFALQHIDFGAVESMQGMPSKPSLLLGHLAV